MKLTASFSFLFFSILMCSSLDAMKRGLAEENEPRKARISEPKNIIEAIEQKNKQGVDSFIKADTDVDVLDNPRKGTCLLWRAAVAGSLPVFSTLWRLSTKKDRQIDALLIAAASGHAEIVEFIIKDKKEYLNARGSSSLLKRLQLNKYPELLGKITALIAAVINEKDGVVDLLVAAKADCTSPFDPYGNALFWAIVAENEKSISHIFQADPARLFGQVKPLLFATRHTHKAAIIELLFRSFGDSTQIKEQDCLDLIGRAIENQSPEVLFFLLDLFKGRGASFQEHVLMILLKESPVERKKKQGIFLVTRTALMIEKAVLTALEQVKEWYPLDHAQYAHLRLINAIIGENCPIIESILTQYPDLLNKPVLTPHPKTPLHWASIHNQCSAIQVLCKIGADKQSLCLDELCVQEDGKCMQVTPLVSALMRQRYEAAHVLLAGGAQVNGAPIGTRPLDICARFNLPGACEFLIARGADVSDIGPCTAQIGGLCNRRRKRDLFMIAQKGDIDYIEKYTQFLDPNTIDRLVFSGAVLGGRAELAVQALQQGRVLINDSCVELPSLEDRPESMLVRTPLGIACKEGHTELVKVLIAQGASPSIQSYDEITNCTVFPFVSAVIRGHKAIAEYLLTKGDYIKTVDSWNYLAVDHAFKIQNIEAIVFLMQHGSAFSYYSDMIKKVPVLQKELEVIENNFMQACMTGSVENMQKYKELLLPCDTTLACGKSPLTLVIESKNSKAVELIGSWGCTNLAGLATPENHIITMPYELFSAFVVTHENKKFLSSLVPLCTAAGLHQQLALLCKVCRELSVDHRGRTPLQIALSENNIECARILLLHESAYTVKQEALLEQAQSEQMMAVIKSSPDDQEKLIEAFIIASQHNASEVPALDNVNIRDRKGRTLLSRIVELGDSKVIDYLIRHKALVDIPDNQGTTPLMRAAWYGHTRIAEQLVDAGATIDLQDAAQCTVYHYAGRRGTLEVAYICAQKEQSNNCMPVCYIEAMRCGHYKKLIEVLKNGQSSPQAAFFENEVLCIFRLACAGQYRKMVEMILDEFPLLITQDVMKGALQTVALLFDMSITPLLLKKIPLHLITSEMQKYVADSIGKEETGFLAGELAKMNKESRVELCKDYLCLFYTRDAAKQYLANPQGTLNEFIKRCADYIRSFNDLQDETRENTKQGGYDAFFENHGNGQTLLMWACIFNDLNAVKEILKQGLPRKYINHQDRFGRTALMYALLYGNFECALALLRFEKSSGTVVNLCGHGINLKDNDEKTALYYAVCACKYDQRAIMRVQEVLKEFSVYDYSHDFGALKILNVMQKLGARFGSFKMQARALEKAAQYGSKEIIVKILGIAPGVFR